MCQGGIYDHLGGGFARYSVDERWLVPHFEKMLYDNAELINLLTLVWQDRRSPLYAQRIEETVGWVLREMRNDQGAFASSLDADSEGVEGKFYVWSEAEIDGLLGPRSAPFKAVYDVTRHGNWEESNILNRLSRIESLDPASEAPLALDRAVLFDARAKRIPPGLDDKVLADWNGLMIAALAFAGDAFARPEWVAAAQSAFRFVQSEMMVDGRLRHSWRDGRARHPATLDDYAALCRAALALYEATGDAAYLTQAEAWLAIVEGQHADPAGPGYFFTAADTPTLITRRKDANDHATPAGNGVLVSVFARLFYVTGKDDYRVRADRLIGAFSGEIQTNFFPLSSLLNGAELLQSAVQIVLLGDPADAATGALADALRHVSLPNRIVIRLRPGQALPPGHPAAGKTLVGGAPTAYVCRGMTCSPPITDAAALRAELEAP
jgi:hypothetical protein